jgi:3-isopropylmalate/(R)-2-methylmalate dehydratase small subunit
VSGIDEGDTVELRVDDGILSDISNGMKRNFNALSPIMRRILDEGGLVPYIKKYGELRVDR